MQKVWFFNGEALLRESYLCDSIPIVIDSRGHMIASTLTNVSNVYEYTEADDSFFEAYDSLSREPIIITPNSG